MLKLGPESVELMHCLRSFVKRILAIPARSGTAAGGRLRYGMRIATVALLVACAFAVAAGAQEFSAIGIARDTIGHVVKSKVYMSGRKVRVDPQETGTANDEAYVILDLAQRTATVVNVGQKTYIQQTPAQARQSLQFYASSASPCPPAGATCKDDGLEALSGRNARKWEISQSVQGQILLTRIWVDTKLHVWTKVEVMTGATLVLSNELQGIQEGSQPASLFVIPAGFRKM